MISWSASLSPARAEWQGHVCQPPLARFPWDCGPHRKTPPGYVGATARLTPWAHLDTMAHQLQDTDAPRLAGGPAVVRFVCRPDCPILYVPAQSVPAIKQRPSSPPVLWREIGTRRGEGRCGAGGQPSGVRTTEGG